MGEMTNPTWTIRVGTVLQATRDISLQELENLLRQGPEATEVVRQGLKAYVTGAVLRTLVEGKEEIIRQVEDSFDDEWDKMVKAHNKKVGRTDNGKMQ